MKKNLLLLILTMTAFGFVTKAQNVNIPDANFKTYLVGNAAINTNGDTEIQVSEASAYTGQIFCAGLSIADLTGIEAFTSLTNIACQANLLTTIDLTQNIALTHIRIENNSLSVLDVTLNTALTNLVCYSNSLSSLDVSQNTALTQLRCYNNSLSSLNVANGNNSNFTLFDATNNPNLTCIQVDNVAYSTSNWTNIDAVSSFSLSCGPCNVNIPDANFKAYLVGNAVINTNSDTEIQCSEASAFSGVMNCSNLSITNLTGVEAFTSMNKLDCRNNALISLDVNSNTALTELYCQNTQLTSLLVNSSTNLNYIYCSNNNLTSLNISNLSLGRLYIQSNSLMSIDVSNHTILAEFNCTNNQLTTLDVSNNTNLSYLNCSANQLSVLDISANVNLGTVDCSSNNITSLDLSNALQGFNQLWCGSNNISTLILPPSTITSFWKIYCQDNALTSLDLSPYSGLIDIQCQDNQLTSLNIANGNNINIDNTDFFAYGNPNLTCIQVDTATWSTANWTNIDATASFSENCGPILINSITVQGQAGVSTITTNGGTLQMEADILPLNADDNSYTWTVSNGTGSATISASGLLSAIADGTVDVIATANDATGITGSKTITISNQTVGIQEILSQNLSIHPNPANNQISFNTSEPIENISIINISGKRVVAINSENNTIDVSDLTKGIYFLQIQIKNGVITNKFIKK